MRVDYYVHGRGRGHAIRSLAIIRRLELDGVDVRIFAGRDAFALMTADPWFKSTEAPRLLPVDSLPPRLSVRSVSRTVRRTIEGIAKGRSDPPDVVISDGDHPGVLAGRALHCPVIAVGHGLIFPYCRRPASVSAGPWRREAFKAWAASYPSHHQVAVSFVPLEPNASTAQVVCPSFADAKMSGSKASCQREALVSSEGDPEGFTPEGGGFRKNLQEYSFVERASSSGRGVVAYFPEGLAARVVPRLRRALDEDVPLTFFGEFCCPGVQTRPLDRADFLEHLARCDRVVASGGSQLIAECQARGKPLFVVHEPEHDEQRLNVELLQLYGVGQGVAADRLTDAQLEEFLVAGRHGSRWHGPPVTDAIASLVRELAR